MEGLPNSSDLFQLRLFSHAQMGLSLSFLAKANSDKIPKYVRSTISKCGL